MLKNEKKLKQNIYFLTCGKNKIETLYKIFSPVSQNCSPISQKQMFVARNLSEMLFFLQYFKKSYMVFKQVMGMAHKFFRSP